MRIILTIWPLLIAAALLLSTNGMQGTVLALRGISEEFSPTVIGLLVSSYSVGFIAGCRYAPGFIANVGHIRAFTAFASIASACALAHAVIVEPAFWLFLRVLSGFCFAAIQMIMESWLNETSTNETRGRTLSIYRIVDFTTVTITQASLTLFDPRQFTAFAFISIAFSLSLVPVALTRITAPAPPKTIRLDLKRLWRVSPLAAAGAVTVGLTSSSFWSMGPVFITGQGYAAGMAGIFIGSIILGGAVAQWPVGGLSDKIDRRRVIVGTAIGASLMALILPFVAGVSEVAVAIGGFAFGVFALPNFGLAVAHANDHAEPGTAVSVNGGLLLLHGCAAVIGPMGATATMTLFGSHSLFWWIAMVYAGLASFSIYRMSVRAAPTVREKYVPVPKTSPTVFQLDPRQEGEASKKVVED